MHPARHVGALSLTRSIGLRWHAGRFDALGVVPTSGPQRGTPFAPRGPGGPVPPPRRYYGVLRLLAVLLAALRFLRLAIPPSRPSFVPVGLGRGPRINLELVSRVSGRHCDGEGKGSQVPVKPVRSSAMFLRPRCDRARLWVQV